jgi:hypothetical protein
MSVLRILGKEHVLLKRFAGYLAWEAPNRFVPGSRLQHDLLTLFCALDRHEDFEEEIYASGQGTGGDASRLTEELSVDHELLAGLRREIIEALKSVRADSPTVRAHLEALVLHLRSYFAWAEEHLWPLYRAPAGSGSDRPTQYRAVSRLRRLADEILSSGVYLTDSSGRGGVTLSGR